MIMLKLAKLAVSLFKLLLSFVLLNYIIDCVNFFTNTDFYSKFFINHNGLSDDKVVSLTKIFFRILS